MKNEVLLKENAVLKAKLGETVKTLELMEKYSVTSNYTGFSPITLAANLGQVDILIGQALAKLKEVQ